MASSLEKQLWAAIKPLVAKAEKAAKEVATEGAATIRDQAKMIVPVDSGRLRDSIVSTQATEVEDGIFEAEAGTNVPYADDVEFGSYANPDVEAPPQPFLRPAAAYSEPTIQKIAESKFKRALEG